MNNILPDSGERTNFGKNAAIRESSDGKGRPSLISPELIFRISKHLELGALKYEPRNWEKGMPYSRVMDSIIRHTFQYLDGDNEEDHLAAIVCNVMFLMHYEKHNKGLLDIPSRMNNEDK